MTSGLRQRAVVSSFICTSPQSPTGLTFALFKRSQGVSTYRGKWAVCSGSIDSTDTSPENAAKREIREETTLTDQDIFLLRKGKPFSLVDQALKTEWTIHPFAWQLKEGAKPITFDWEHTEYHFIKSEDVEKYDHVPQLEVGMQRVMVSPDTERALAVLRDDHESGAEALAVKALNLLKQALRWDEILALSTAEEFWRQFRWIVWHLAKNGRPSMGAAIEAALFKTLDVVQKQLVAPGSEGIGGIPLETLKNSVEKAITECIEIVKKQLERLSTHFVQYVEQVISPSEGETAEKSINIITLSASGTVTAALQALIKTVTKRGITIKLSILESRPKFEGAASVNTLLAGLNNDAAIRQHLEIEIVSDASVASLASHADFLVFGGDKVLPDASVSNKIGTLAASIAAKHGNSRCKVVALFQTSKIVGFDEELLEVEYNDEKEVVDAWPESCQKGIKERRKEGWKIEARNAYFEWVPGSADRELIDARISEEGLLDRGDLERIAKESGELEKRLFGDL
ncbi:hypothetical protein G7Y89_g9767 [Cudoniella acicularis]|uniref:Nudix hydrolase domain-containing protein n=1 Tax=Cudoniella acicularis TaxID=354080 RepID=A0A8H4RF12_9HELO|nr:hypothetical protein G7Y89_g9767 [Cudoniella acicularis]